MDIAQVVPQAGTCTATLQAMASLVALSPIGMTTPATDVPPSSTPRTTLMSSQQTVSKPQLTVKVLCLRKVHLIISYPSTPDSSCQPRMAPSS